MKCAFNTLMAIVLLTGFAGISLANPCPDGWIELSSNAVGYCCQQYQNDAAPENCNSGYTMKSSAAATSSYCCTAN